MKVYFIRHGAYALSGAVQALTPQGRNDTKKMAEYLKGCNALIEEIWHSPKTRAVESAQIFSRVFVCENVMTKDFLIPNADPDQAIEDLENSTSNNIAIVSHLPFIPNLLSKIFLKGQCSLPEFVTASVVVVTRENGQWKFLEFITPDSL